MTLIDFLAGQMLQSEAVGWKEPRPEYLDTWTLVLVWFLITNLTLDKAICFIIPFNNVLHPCFLTHEMA